MIHQPIFTLLQIRDNGEKMKRLAILFFIACILSLPGCQRKNAEQSLQNETYALVVNGNDAGQIVYDTKEKLVELPLVKMLQNLGAEISWEDKKTAHILYQDTRLILDLSNESLQKEKNGFVFDLLLPPPGDRYDMRVYSIGKELMVDDKTLLLFLNDYHIQLKFDHPNKTVFIAAADPFIKETGS